MPESNEGSDLSGKITKNKDAPYLIIENSSNSCMARAIVELERKSNELSVRKKSRQNIAYHADITKKEDDECVIESLYRTDGTCKYCRNPPTLGAGVIAAEMTAPLDWQVDLVSPLQRLTGLFSLGHLTDVTIKFGNSQTKYQVIFCFNFGNFISNDI